MLSAYRDLWNLPRGLWVLFWATVVNRMGTMVLPFFTLYLTQSRELSPKVAGLFLGLYGLVAVVAAPLSGFVGARFGAARVLTFSLAISALVLLVFPWLPGEVGLFLGVVALSLTTELFRPTVFALTSEVADDSNRAQGVVLIRLAANIGMSLGPALGGILVHISYPILFWVDGITSLISAALTYYFLIIKRWIPANLIHGQGKGATANAWWHEVRTISRDRTFLALWGGIFFILIVFFQHESSWPLILVKEKGFSEAAYGLMFTINTVLIILVEVPFTQWLRRFPVRYLLMISSVLMVISIAGVAWAKTLWDLAWLVVLFTIAEMMSFPISTTWVGDHSPPGQRATYMGFYVMSFSASFVIGTMLGPAVWEWKGTEVLSYGMIAMGIFAILFFQKMQRAKIHAS